MDNLSLAKPDGQVGLKKKDTTITTPEKIIGNYGGQMIL